MISIYMQDIFVKEFHTKMMDKFAVIKPLDI
jgi:hypothetical protein